MLAEFEKPSEGQIFFQGTDITDLPPNERKINTVFQKYALFPHLNIYDNISFGLKEKFQKEVDRRWEICYINVIDKIIRVRKFYL